MTMIVNYKRGMIKSYFADLEKTIPLTLLTKMCSWAPAAGSAC